MKIAIMQPTFAPWIGQFEMMDYVDKFIFLDTVQYVKREWQNRNKIRVNDKEYMFSIPVKKPSRSLILKDAIIFEDFRERLINMLNQYYKKAPFFKEIHPFMKEIINYQTDYLSEFNINFITQIAKKLGIDTEFITLSKTNFKTEKKKGELILEICKYFDAKVYVSPFGAMGYMKEVENKFKNLGIEVIYQNYNHPTYHQNGEFISHLSIIDYLYNEGFNLEKILNGRNYILNQD